MTRLHDILGKSFDRKTFRMPVILQSVHDSVIVVTIDKIESNPVVSSLDRADAFS